MLPKPTTQLQSVLYDLVVCDKGIDEQTSGFNGFRARISELREHLNIKETVVKFRNQFGRMSDYKKHWIANDEKKKATKLYLSLHKSTVCQTKS